MCNCEKDNTKECCISIGMGCVTPVVANADNYYTKSQVDEIVEGIEVSGVTPEQVDEMIDDALLDYYNSDEIDDALSLKQDISGMTAYATTAVTDALSNDLSAHTADTSIHVSQSDKNNWDSKQNQLVSGQNIKTINNESLLGSGNINIQGGGGVTPEQVEGMIDSALENYYNESEIDSALSAKQDVSGMTNYATTATTSALSNDLTAHTSDSTIHVTSADKANWNGKSNFSGDYNDLSNKPTIPVVPTNVSSFVNDSGYITNSDLSDYATESYVQDYTYDKETIDEKVAGGGTFDPTQYYNKTATDERIAAATSGKADSTEVSAINAVVTAHTADTSIHVTNAEKASWNSKSDFSGDYNDLSNKPTIPVVPTNISAFVNDVPYITTAVTNPINNTLTAHTADTSIHVTSADKTTWNNKQDELSVGNGISIVNNTISLNIPISAGTGANSLIYNDYNNSAVGTYSNATGNRTVASGLCSHAEGFLTQALQDSSHAEGVSTIAGGNYSHAEGVESKASGDSSHAEGYNTVALNATEHASGRFNVSSALTTLFTVGNGNLINDVEKRHNALQINVS